MEVFCCLYKPMLMLCSCISMLGKFCIKMWKHRAQTERSLCLSVTKTHSSVRTASARFRFLRLLGFLPIHKPLWEPYAGRTTGGKLPGLQCAKMEWHKKVKQQERSTSAQTKTRISDNREQQILHLYVSPLLCLN